ncbi:MAG TPA: ABC transporter substrate-binding protein [Anaerolineae bacterium]|nr:ABC transporter substrate-binding protein [Anaerolineae bacterium]
MSRKLFAVTLLLALLLGACAPAAAPQPIATSAPTARPTAAPTSVPTLAPTTTPAEPPAPTSTPAAAPIQLTDGLGRSIELPAPAQRIVSIAPSNTEILFALGAGGQVVGREEMSDYPAAAKNVTSIGSVFQKMNTEAIVALNPDLILAAEINSPEQVKALEDLKLTVYYLANPKTFDDLYANLETVGKLTGRSAEAAKLNESLKARYDVVIQKLSQAKDAPTVFYEIDATDPTKPYTSGPGTFIDLVITLAGGKNIGIYLKDSFGQFSSEELVRMNPEIIVLGDALYGVTPESVAQRPGWNALNAVKNNQVVAFDDNLISRPGPRLIDGLEQMAKLIHPELFK